MGLMPLQPSTHQSNDWVTSMSEAPLLVSNLQEAIAQYREEDIFLVSFKEWQDDYESQYAKVNRSSVWCKNITIIAEPGTPRHLCTYPIAFSNTATYHHCVETEFEKDMQRFKKDGDNLFFSSKLGKQIRIHARLYVSVADQLERRPVTCTTAGNHSFHARFGYSIRYKALLDRLPSCVNCRQFINDKVHSIYNGNHISDPRLQYDLPSCDLCFSWLSDLTRYPDLSYPAPDNYPPSELDVQGNIRPFKLSFPRFIEAVSHSACSECHNRMSQ